MKVLWITNILLPDICSAMGWNAPVTGGWMSALAGFLTGAHPELELAVASVGPVEELVEKEVGGIRCFILPQTSRSGDWKAIQQRFAPEVVHIHGTEYAYGLEWIRECGNAHAVVSIQGLVDVYARYSLGGIERGELKKYRTLQDYLRPSLLKLPQRMAAQGQLEIEYMKTCGHFIGRTEWDRVHLWAVNPSAKYHFCNEMLREPFYHAHWNRSECEPHTIFLSQGAAPLKGLHQVLKAMPLILREFPDAKIRLAGSNIFSRKTLREKLKFSLYANYISSLIKRLGLREHFEALGLCPPERMVAELKRCNVFICPSSIENSPNSLGEAQLTGVPCIASYAGGIPDFAAGGAALLYRFEETEMLADHVCSVFRSPELAEKLSAATAKAAAERHNRDTICEEMMRIYRKIAS